MKVVRLPENPGVSGWNKMLPPSPNFHELEESQTADWLIIGAGFAGLAAARRLQMEAPDDRIIVLEAKNLAEGPAGRNSGFMIDLPHNFANKVYTGKLEKDRQRIGRNRQAIEFAKKIVEQLDIPKEAFKEVGKISGSANKSGANHNQKYAAHLTKLEEPHELYDAQTMREITGTNYYNGGLFTPGTVMLQPALYIRSLGKKLISNKLQIYERSPVVSLVRRGLNWWAETPKGHVTSPKVILATNGHIESFGFFKQKLIHVFTYASMTRALTFKEQKALGGVREWGITPAHPMGTTVRRISGIGGARIIVRNRFTYEPSMQPPKNSLKHAYNAHKRSFDARFPCLEGVEMEHKWGGHLALSLNDAVAFGEVESNLFASCCQNGLGTVRGTLHGMAVADFAMGKKTDLVVKILNSSKLKKLPPKPILSLAIKTRISLGEFLAGKEF